jgi:glutathione S-transferase
VTRCGWPGCSASSARGWTRSKSCSIIRQTGTFCHGDTPGLADICLIPQLYNANRWGVDISGLSRIAAIGSACEALPAFTNAHPDACKGSA